jgi:site-specific DNA recombinase
VLLTTVRTSDDPHEQLVVQIRGAVAQYERTLIADRMRRGRLAELRAVDQRAIWLSSAPERPRDPALVEVDEAAAAVVRELFETYADGEATLHALAVRLIARYCFTYPPPFSGQGVPCARC